MPNERITQNGFTIACFPPYPPVELFASMGLHPLTLWNLGARISGHHAANHHIQSYVCRIAIDLGQLLLSEPAGAFDGIFTYNACDTLRNISDILSNRPEEAGRAAKIFRLHLPQVNHDSSPQQDFLKDEITRLRHSLEEGFGVIFSPERFFRTTLAFKEMRELCSAGERLVARGRIPFGAFSDTVLSGYRVPVGQHIRNLERLIDGAGAARPGKNILISGIMPPPPALAQAMEKAGLCIAANDIASLRRSYGYAPEPSESPEAYYEDLFSSRIPCTTLLSMSDRRVDYLLDLADKSGARGVIFLGEKFCENEYLEFPFLTSRLEARGLPVLCLEMTPDAPGQTGACITRVDAFAEML